MFTAEYYTTYRADCQSLTCIELNMLLKGEIISHFNDSYMTSNSTHHRHLPQLRQVTSTTYYHRGVQICRKTFIFLHFIGTKGIHPPGRIPGFKKKDIQHLPCHTTKKAVRRQYCLATQTSNPPARQAAYRTFLLIWKKLLPNIIIGKQMTDLCWY